MAIVLSEPYQAAKVRARQTEKTILEVMRETWKLSDKLSVKRVPAMEIRTTTSQYRTGLYVFDLNWNTRATVRRARVKTVVPLSPNPSVVFK